MLKISIGLEQQTDGYLNMFIQYLGKKKKTKTIELISFITQCINTYKYI